MAAIRLLILYDKEWNILLGRNETLSNAYRYLPSSVKKMSFLIDATWFKNMVSRKWHAKKAYDAQKNCLVIFELKNAFKKRIHF